ncbi:T9SS C-terminal target domain-containing protein [candidate division KSB1 bacterium]|nr:MAG: T9SS C-terminal target domain-containing protein [candidate division KSB1 bacterium]
MRDSPIQTELGTRRLKLLLDNQEHALEIREVALKNSHRLVTLIGAAALIWIFAGFSADAADKIKVNEKKSAATVGINERGGRSLDNQGGPDGFGYKWVDNLTGDTATYSWIELRGDPAATWLDFSDDPDDAVLPATIGFEFPIYGMTFSTVHVSTNGNLQFTTTDEAFSANCLPDPIINGPMICAYWDDLHLDNGGYDPGGTITVAYRNFGDHFVVEWDSVGNAFGINTIYKFEAILWTDGRIKLQYAQVEPGVNVGFETVGIQAGSSGPALQYVCYDAGHQPTANLAIWIYQCNTGTVTGFVRDGQGQPISLATVHLAPFSIATTTDFSGSYAFPMACVGTYSMTASRAGYLDGVVNNVVVASGQTTHADFTLQWMGIYNFFSSDVPRNTEDMDTVTSTLAVSQSMIIGDVDVQLSITHTYAHDLLIYLTAPGGQTIMLSNQHGGSGENYTNTIFDDDAVSPIALGNTPFTGSFIPDELLSALNGSDAQGTWTLSIGDFVSGDDGQLISWEIHVTPALAADDPIAAHAEEFALAGNYPNPFNSTTNILFIVPRAAPVTLTLYNLLGQEVRTLINSTVQPGTHSVAWDGRNANGMDAVSGLYLVRMDAAGFTSTGKLFLLR